MYQAQSSFLATYAPGCPLEYIHVVSGEVFFDQDMTRQIGHSNKLFIVDPFHLYDSSLLKIFGKTGYTLLKSHLLSLVQASPV